MGCGQPAAAYFTGALHAVHTTDPGIESVALLHGATGFARDVAAGARLTATGLGLHLAAREFAPGAAEARAAVLPFVTLMPSGIFAVMRAQEAGCQYIRST